MKRGDLFRVYKGSKYDTKKYRVFVVVSRQLLIDSNFSTVICAPIYSNYDGLSTQVRVGIDVGLKHESAIYCDELISLKKAVLKDYIGTLSDNLMSELDQSIRIAIDVEC